MFHVSVSLKEAWSVLDDPVQELHMAALVGADDTELLLLKFWDCTEVRRCKASGSPAAPKASLHTAHTETAEVGQEPEDSKETDDDLRSMTS